VGLGHALVQDCAAVSADQELDAVAQQPVSLEGHQRVALPADSDIFAAAEPALSHRKLIHHGRFLRFCIFANTQYRKSRRIANERRADTENSTKPTMRMILILLREYFY